MSDVITRIVESIKNSGMSIREIADATGIPKSTIQRYSVGDIKRLPLDKLKKLAAAVGTTPEAIMGCDGSADAQPVQFHKVPLLGAVGAGIPKLASEDYDEYIETYGEADFALTVDGNSMEPTILKGDIALIRVQSDVEDGQIAAVLLDDSAVIKRVTHIPNGLVLISDNSSYPPRIVTAAEYDTVKVLGRVTRIERMI